MVNQSFHFLQRIPEQELMSDQDQVVAYANADFSVAHQTIVSKLQSVLPTRFFPKTVLDLGSGPGDMSSRLFSLFPSAYFTFLDGSEAMLQVCQGHFQSKGYFAGENRMLFVHQRVQEWIPESPYDLVFSNSVLHHLKDPYEFWAALQRSLHADTFFFIADLIRPNSRQDLDKLVQQYTQGESKQLVLDFENSLFAAHRLEEVEDMLRKTRLWSRCHLEVISDRHWVCYTKLDP